MSEQVAWGAILLALITAIGTGWNTWSQRKQKQDQLQYDVKLMKLEGDLANCSDKHNDVADQLKECKEDHKTSEQDRSRLWAHVQRLQDWVQSPEKKHLEGLPPHVAS